MEMFGCKRFARRGCASALRTRTRALGPRRVRTQEPPRLGFPLIAIIVSRGALTRAEVPDILREARNDLEPYKSIVFVADAVVIVGKLAARLRQSPTAPALSKENPVSER